MESELPYPAVALVLSLADAGLAGEDPGLAGGAEFAIRTLTNMAREQTREVLKMIRRIGFWGHLKFTNNTDAL